MNIKSIFSVRFRSKYFVVQKREIIDLIIIQCSLVTYDNLVHQIHHGNPELDHIFCYLVSKCYRIWTHHQHILLLLQRKVTFLFIWMMFGERPWFVTLTWATIFVITSATFISAITSICFTKANVFAWAFIFWTCLWMKTKFLIKFFVPRTIRWFFLSYKWSTCTAANRWFSFSVISTVLFIDTIGTIIYTVATYWQWMTFSITRYFIISAILITWSWWDT